MTLEELSQLSFYEELVPIDSSCNFMLVRHRDTRKLYVKKTLSFYDRSLYEILKQNPVAGIPHLHLLIEDSGKLILIEDYIHGDTLESIWEQSGRLLPEQTIINWMLQICQILVQLHAMDPPVIHRDLKPSNLILSEDGFVKLIDFNVARRVDPDKQSDTEFFGTQLYAAPEQYGFGQSDQRTDIYSLGVIMNVLLTGEGPYQKPAEGKLKPIIQRCVAINPKDRFQSAEYLMAALNNIYASNRVPTSHGREQHDANLTPVLIRSNPAVFAGSIASYSKLPPGFRTGKIWKMLIAVPSYIAMLFLAIDISSGMEGELFYRIISGCLFGLMEYSTVFWFCNYLNCHNRLPLMNREKYLRYLFLLVYWGVLLGLELLVFCFIIAIFA